MSSHWNLQPFNLNKAEYRYVNGEVFTVDIDPTMACTLWWLPLVFVGEIFASTMAAVPSN